MFKLKEEEAISINISYKICSSSSISSNRIYLQFNLLQKAKWFKLIID